MRARGLNNMGYGTQRCERMSVDSQTKTFKALYGCTPTVCVALWIDLQKIGNEEKRLCVRDVEDDIKAFLLTLRFLKAYPRAVAEAGRFGWGLNKCREKKWAMIDRLVFLCGKTIKWPAAWTTENSANIPTFLVSVDGIHCEIQEPSHGRWSKNTAYYSHKFEKSALAYEVAIAVFESKVVWINGPFPAATQDITIFKQALEQKIPTNCYAVVDNGYSNRPKLALPSPVDSPALRKFKSRIRARQESFNTLLKNFDVLKQQFRHGETQHGDCFRAVAVICQYQLDHESPLFDP